MTQSEFITVLEASVVYGEAIGKPNGVSPSVITRKLAAEQIKGEKTIIGGRHTWRVNQESLLDYIDRMKATNAKWSSYDVPVVNIEPTAHTRPPSPERAWRWLHNKEFAELATQRANEIDAARMNPASSERV